MKPGDKYTLTKEPSFSTGGRIGREVSIVDMGNYLAFKLEDITWPANEYEII